MKVGDKVRVKYPDDYEYVTLFPRKTWGGRIVEIAGKRVRVSSDALRDFYPDEYERSIIDCELDQVIQIPREYREAH